MATKQIRKTTSGPSQASENKTKTKAKPKLRKPAKEPDTKTKVKTAARDDAGASTKAKASTRHKPEKAAATKTKGLRRKVEPATGTKTSRRRSLATPEAKVRNPETNGHVAEHAGTTAASKPGNEIAPAAATKPGTQRKTARPPQEEQIFLSLFEALDAHAKSQGIGHVAKDALFDWGESESQELNPDLAFVSFDRWAPYRHVPNDLTWHVVPDLVVQILRRSEQTEPISTWLDHYFHAGVNRVWVVYPDQLKIHDHASLASSRVIDRDQMLDGGSILPGFQMSVKALLEPKEG
jgi:Uma2 family endonuclease